MKPYSSKVSCDFGAARHLVMDERGVRCVDDPQAGAPHAQAKVEVVVDDRVTLVETADFVERRAPHQQAGAGQARDVALRCGQTEAADILALGEPKGVPPVAVVQKQAGVLDAAVGIEQPWPHHPDFAPLRMLHQRVQPARLDGLDIVVEEQQIFAERRLGPEIVELRPVERGGVFHDAIGVALQPIRPAASWGRRCCRRKRSRTGDNA